MSLSPAVFEIFGFPTHVN